MSLVQLPMMPENFNDVIEYSYIKDGNKKLSEHFHVEDFKSEETDRVLISNRLIETLEVLYKYLNATDCVIKSGYRSAREEAKTSGTFQDPHVLGAAADVIFYKGAAPIDSRNVCLALQDLGFEGGAAPIGELYTDGTVQIEAAGKRYFNKNTKLPEIEVYSVDKGYYEAKDFRDEIRASLPSAQVSYTAAAQNTVSQIKNMAVTGDTELIISGAVLENGADLNGDGVVDDKDIDLVSKYITKKGTLTSAQQKLADLNGDGAVTNTDLQLITSYIKEGLSGIKVRIGSSGALVYDNLGNVTTGSLSRLDANSLVTLDSKKVYDINGTKFVRIKTSGTLESYIRLTNIAGYDEVYASKNYFNEDGSLISDKLFFDVSKVAFDFYKSSSGATGNVNGNKCWPTTSKSITSYFGNRTVNGNPNYHSGIDIGVSTGTSVFAAMSGTITSVEKNKGYNTFNQGIVTYGNYIYLTPKSNSNMTIVYGHLSDVQVSVGQEVKVGQQIALSGNSGYSRGAHLHFGVKINGTDVNPLNYFIP